MCFDVFRVSMRFEFDLFKLFEFSICEWKICYFKNTFVSYYRTVQSLWNNFKMPKALTGDCQKMVISLIRYFENERDNNGPLLPLNAVRDRVAAALNISINTVWRISAKLAHGDDLVEPKKSNERKKPILDIDDGRKAAIRNCIYDMYKNKEQITLKTLGDKLAERFLFDGGITSLWKLLKSIGFKFSKDDPRRGMIELPHIALKRIAFLQSYMRMKNEGLRQFVYLDETWIFQDGTIGHSWQDSSVKSVKKNKVGGTRFIVLHAGCDDGFIPGAELVFSSKTKNEDYHGEMNHDNFLKWFEHQLLMKLETPSTIVMDNASYHSTVVNKVPTSASRKEALQEWLTNNNIHFNHRMLKPQLWNLVKLNKPPPSYMADTLAEQYGHQVLRLPPYHCIFNPIELIWGITKNYYKDHVGQHGSSAEKSLNTWKEALTQVTPEMWANAVRHTEGIIQSWWERENILDENNIHPVIINVGAVFDFEHNQWKI